MKNNIGHAGRRTAGLGLLALAVTLPSALHAQTGGAPAADTERIETEGTASAQTPETVIQKWPERSRTLSRAMIEKYGQPSRFTANELVWNNNGPWQKTVVYRESWMHLPGMRDKDYLEQSVGYQIPDEKVEDVKRFDKRIAFNKDKGELSSRAESESMNYLALNLAEEIATNKRTVEDARDFYRKTEGFSKSGKSSPYLNGLMFATGHDKDRTAGDKSVAPVEQERTMNNTGTPENIVNP